MSFKIALSENGTHLRVRVDEPMSRTLATEIAEALTKLAEKHGVKNYLYDVRNAPNVESVIDNYTFAYEDMSKMEIDREANVAILIREDDTSHDFVETALRNAGYNVRTFDDEAAALAWLGQTEPS